MKGLTHKQRSQLLKISEDVQGEILQPVTGECEESIAFVQLMRICRDYTVYGAHGGRYRNEKALLERLNKFNIRFYENI